MVVVLWPHRSYAAAYLDDVIIHSSTWAEHLQQLRVVLEELQKAILTTNPCKCHLALTKAQYLGYRIGMGLLRPLNAKIEAVKGYPQPTTKHQVCAFLGVAG